MASLKIMFFCLIVLALFMAFALALIVIALGNPSVQQAVVELVQALASIRGR